MFIRLPLQRTDAVVMFVPEYKSLLFISVADLGKQMSKVKNNLSVAERNLSIALKKYNRLQMDYENLIEICHELVDQLESTVKGVPVSALSELQLFQIRFLHFCKLSVFIHNLSFTTL